jgi:hypothetical protein
MKHKEAITNLSGHLNLFMKVLKEKGHDSYVLYILIYKHISKKQNTFPFVATMERTALAI